MLLLSAIDPTFVAVNVALAAIRLCMFTILLPGGMRLEVAAEPPAQQLVADLVHRIAEGLGEPARHG